MYRKDWLGASVEREREWRIFLPAESLEGDQQICLRSGPELRTLRKTALLMKHLHLRK